MITHKEISKIIDMYALALYRVAKSLDAIDKTIAEAETFLKTVASSEKFKILVEGPNFSVLEKHTLIDKTLKKFFSPTIINLIYVLIDNGRAELLSDVLETFMELAENEKLLFAGFISTAKELSDGEKTKLEKALEKFAKKKLHVRYNVDPKLIGGVMFKLDDTYIDATIKGQLSKLYDKLKLGSIS